MSYNNSSANTNILVLGTITNTSQTYSNNYCIYLNSSNNSKVILGPQALYYVNNTLHNFGIICLRNDYNSFLLYPGCEIKPNNETSSNYTLRCDNGYIQLNRYVTNENTNKLNGLIYNYFHIIYPTTIANDDKNNLKDEYQIQNIQINGNSWYITPYFPKLYSGEMYYSEDTSDDQCYHFEEPDFPLLFNYNEEFNKNILGINKYNELAKYDVKLWDQCKVENGIYSFKEFVNINKNKDKLIDIDTLEDLFMDGKSYQPKDSTQTGLLNNMPNVINIGLTGTKNITIYTDGTEVILLGNNSGYTGTMTIPDSINDVYLKKLSIIPNGIISNGKTYTITIDESNNITYKVDDTSTKPENLELKFHFIDIDLLPQLKDLEDKLTKAKSNLENANKAKEEINTELTNANKAKDEIQKQLDNTTSELTNKNTELTNTNNNKRLVEEKLEKVKKELEELIKQQNSNTTTTSQVKPSKSVATQTGYGSIKHSKNEYKCEYVWKLCENGDTKRYKLDHHHNKKYSDNSD